MSLLITNGRVITASDDYVDEEAGQRVSAARVLERTEKFAGPGKLLWRKAGVL